jgi:hypothetical protein
MAPTTTAAAVDPYVTVNVTPDGSPPTSSEDFHFSAYSSSATIVPSECAGGAIAPLAIDENTWHEIVVVAVDYARPLSFMIYEIGETPATAANGVGVDAQVGVGSPILDDQHDDWATSAVNLWQKNSAQLISWANYPETGGAGPPTRSASATYRNILDSSSTTVSAATPGFVLDLAYHQRVTPSATVPVVLAVYAEKTAGVGTAANNKVRLTDGTNSIEVTGINTAGWYTATGSMAATDGVKWDAQARTSTVADGGADDTIAIYAVSLYQYQ